MVKAYFESSFFVGENDDPLVWWSGHATEFGLLHMVYILYFKSFQFPLTFVDKFKVARDLLCVPATSAASERVFKAADDHITHDRNRLKPENASKLIFMQQALKNAEKSLYELCYESNYENIDENQPEDEYDEQFDTASHEDDSSDEEDEDAILIESRNFSVDPSEDHDVSDVLWVWFHSE